MLTQRLKHFDRKLGMLPTGGLMAALCWLAAAGPLQGAETPQAPAAPQQGKATADESSDWIFDAAPYSDNPATGKRVWQYAKDRPAYRDPNSVFESPHSPYPFAPDLYDPLWNYGHYGYGDYFYWPGEVRPALPALYEGAYPGYLYQTPTAAPADTPAGADDGA